MPDPQPLDVDAAAEHLRRQQDARAEAIRKQYAAIARAFNRLEELGEEFADDYGNTVEIVGASYTVEFDAVGLDDARWVVSPARRR
jgi:hypothetical protein